MAINLSLPQPPGGFDLGLEERGMQVLADLELDAVELTVPGEFEIVLSPTATIDLIMKLTGALAQLDLARDE